jgi:hypothetical protein
MTNQSPFPHHTNDIELAAELNLSIKVLRTFIVEHEDALTGFGSWWGIPCDKPTSSRKHFNFYLNSTQVKIIAAHFNNDEVAA